MQCTAGTRLVLHKSLDCINQIYTALKKQNYPYTKTQGVQISGYTVLYSSGLVEAWSNNSVVGSSAPPPTAMGGKVLCHGDQPGQRRARGETCKR
jgi:hypothetical protein